MATSYVAPDQSQAVLFAFDINPRFDEKIQKVKLQGLDPAKRYTVREINRMPTTDKAGNVIEPSDEPDPKQWAEDGKTYSGDYLMKVGLDAFTGSSLHSRVVELNAAR